MEAVVLVAVSCVLAIHMGLVDAIGDTLHYRFRVLNCTKCLVFWSEFVIGLVCGRGVLASVATAFICAYVALWADLALSYLSKYYNRWYEKIDTEADDSDEDSLP